MSEVLYSVNTMLEPDGSIELHIQRWERGAWVDHLAPTAWDANLVQQVHHALGKVIEKAEAR